jgi:hypothetical protein
MRFSFHFTCSCIIVAAVTVGRAEEPLVLRERFPVGYQYVVSSRVDLTGSLALPGESGQKGRSLAITGNSAIEYAERILALDQAGEVAKTARVYRRVDFNRKVGDRPQENTIRPGVRRMVLLRKNHVEVPFSPDGPLLWNEIDLVRTDVFTPSLGTLLPTQAVRIGDRWTAGNDAIQELTDLERIEEGKIECRLDQVTMLNRHRLARITFVGTVRGVNEDGPNRQHLDGYCFFDLESKHISYVSLKGIHTMLDKDGKEQGRVEGQFVLTRELEQRCSELSENAWRGIKVEPDDDNTLLLYDNPDIGVRFLYPRRWRVAGMRGRQLGIDETNGSGLLLTFEQVERVPNGAQFLAESRKWLTDQKARIKRVNEPRLLQGPPNILEQFSIDMESQGKPAVLEYYVIRQKLGGATLAARLLPTDAGTLRRDVERIARSLQFTKPFAEPKK